MSSSGSPSYAVPGGSTSPAWPLPRSDRRLPPGWPIAAAVAGWPLWWALGVTILVFPLAAIPLAWSLHRRGRVKTPPGLRDLGALPGARALSVFALDVELVGTAMSSGIGRYFAFGFRLLNYLALTVMLLYLGNTTEAELPRRRVISWFCVARGVVHRARRRCRS